MTAAAAVEVSGGRRLGRFRTWHSVAAGLLALVALSGLSVYLTTPRDGGLLDPAATGPSGAHALVALLRDRGIEVVVAGTVADVEHSARPDALTLVANGALIADSALVQRLGKVPGDRLLVQPTATVRQALAPAIRTERFTGLNRKPDCELREAVAAGTVDLQAAATYAAAGDQQLHSCYDGALVRYRADGRTVTVLGAAFPLTNSGLLHEGNAALAMNLAGAAHRLVWYAPQRVEGGGSGTATIADLIPPNAYWLVLQLCLAVALAALWKGRRIGPLVAEHLPVVVRASETVEGRGRLYRSRRARDRAAQALRTAALQRLSPRLGLTGADPAAVAAAIAQRSATHPESVWRSLFGPPPDSDTALLQLARMLDEIERQVTRS